MVETVGDYLFLQFLALSAVGGALAMAHIHAGLPLAWVWVVAVVVLIPLAVVSGLLINGLVATRREDAES